MTARAPAPVFDLLAWPAVEAARAERDAAELAVAEAKRRWLLSPHGKVRERLSGLQEANHRLLKAGQELARVMLEAEH